jgi:hypothetical protein
MTVEIILSEVTWWQTNAMVQEEIGKKLWATDTDDTKNEIGSTIWSWQ